MDEFADSREYFLRVWHNLLERALGWSKERVDAWAAELESLGRKETVGLLFHEPPIYWTTTLFIPPSLQQIRGKLNNDIYMALTGGKDPTFEDEVEVKEACARVEEVLKRYGESLKSVRG